VYLPVSSVLERSVKLHIKVERKLSSSRYMPINAQLRQPISAGHSVSLVRFILCNNQLQCVKKDTLYNVNQTLKDYTSVEQTPNNLAAYCWSIAGTYVSDDSVCGTG
jgi:hypothetical protein